MYKKAMAYQPVPNEAVGMPLFFLFYILIGNWTN